MSSNLYCFLREGFPADLDRTAITTDTGREFTWRELEAMVHLLASWLAEQEDDAASARGLRIAVQVEKSVEAALYLASLYAGWIHVPFNTAYRSAEMADFLKDCEPTVVVCSPAHHDWIKPLALAVNVKSVVTLAEDGTGTLLAASALSARAPKEPASVAGNDVAVILYTSGTTGRSKGAMLTHDNLRSNAATLDTYWGWQRERDVLIHALPIFHVHGLMVALHGALRSGSRILWMARFDPERAVQWFTQATVFMGVPTLYVRMLAVANLTPTACRAMRLFISGSAPLLIDTFEAWRERTGHTILERYGMSETVMLTSNPYFADIRYSGAAERRGGTVGMPLPGVDIRVADAEDQPLPTATIGGIQVRGPNVFKGYWRMPEKTASEFTTDGYFRTGDVGEQDESGYVRIVGRSKDLIISGGYNVYPAEVESYINALAGVSESAVIGVPHPDFGEVGLAIVVAKPGVQLEPDELINALKNSLANFKVPKRCLVVDELPRNAMGKVQKNVLRQRYAEPNL
jgi:malonyl-CoA/methylmalonyl-CoA synthetase